MTMERESPGNREIRKEMIDYNGIYSFPYCSLPTILSFTYKLSIHLDARQERHPPSITKNS